MLTDIKRTAVKLSERLFIIRIAAIIMISLTMLFSIAACEPESSNRLVFDQDQQSSPSPTSTPTPLPLSDSPSLTPSITASLPKLSEKDVPAVPSLDYRGFGDNEWELKRLRLSRQGFAVLDERGRVSRSDGHFELNDAKDSDRRGVEQSDEYLSQTFWFGLDEILTSDIGEAALGFIEYYGCYYLVAEEERGIYLYALGLVTPVVDTRPFIGGMRFDEFCEKAWQFFCYVENSPETIYGGDGINI